MITYCEKCGTKNEKETFPKKCSNCSLEVYKNPIPVVVLIVPIKGMGVLIEKRAIPPQVGQWALPSGFIDDLETLEEAAKRELREEVGIDEDLSITVLGVESSSHRKNILIFVKTQELDPSLIDKFLPNHEVSEIKTVLNSEELAFPSHTKYLEMYFKK